MNLSPREILFVKEEMERVENSKDRRSYDQTEAENVRRKAEHALTE